MEIDEHWLHSHRRQVIKTLTHLIDARKAIGLADEHAKKIGGQSELCKFIESNIGALYTGLQETVTLCGQAAQQFKEQMSDPTAKPSPIHGALKWKNISPFQRALMREGKLSINDIPTTEVDRRTTDAQRRAPKILDFTLKEPKKRKPKNREMPL